MKSTKIIFWVTTVIIFLWEGVMPALTGNTQMAIDGIRHLGYPDYFRVMLNVFKILGVLALIIPMVPRRVKEWAYAGFAISLISATVSHLVVDGFSGMSLFPLAVFAILATSYVSWDKLEKGNQSAT